jgi:hypothetical protein
LTFDEINFLRNKEIEEVNKKYDLVIEELQSNCNHTDMEEYCDDDDCDGWREPTYAEWKVCKLCGYQENV